MKTTSNQNSQAGRYTGYCGGGGGGGKGGVCVGGVG